MPGSNAQRLSFRIVVILLFIGLWKPHPAFCQTDSPNNSQWHELRAQYKTGEYDDTAYLNRAGILAQESYDDPFLKDKLATYHELAFNDQQYQQYRILYYKFLANNASLTFRAGASIYYAEKVEEERKKTKPYLNTLNVPKLIFYIYGKSTSGVDRCLEEYKRILPFLNSLPKRIITDSVPPATYLNAMILVEGATRFYAGLKKDTFSTRNAGMLAEDLWRSLKQKNNPDKEEIQESLLSLYLIKYREKKLVGAYKEAKEYLDSCSRIIAPSNKNINPIYRDVTRNDLLLEYTNFFIERKQNDSARQYLQQLAGSGNRSYVEFADSTNYLFTLSTINANEHDYEKAYNNLFRAYEINDSMIGIRTADITNNMYAQTAAEFNAEQLKVAEAQAYRRNIMIGIISICSMLLIVLLYLQSKRKERRAKEQIVKLNFASQLQIIELEEKSRLIQKEEQKRLGMDLHDNLSGTLAGLKTFVESELYNNINEAQVSRLSKISEIISKLYESTRSKSHSLFHNHENDFEIAFSKRIKLITDNSLSLKSIHVVTDVDDALLSQVPIRIKIELLYIIQEAVTNIIKHAAATEISILIYEDVTGLVMQIIDNGKGFDEKHHRGGIGLRSIKERAKSAGGNAEIFTGQTGTEIRIIIPMSVIK